jgi:8-oxo-dGTP diphosphatase
VSETSATHPLSIASVTPTRMASLSFVEIDVVAVAVTEARRLLLVSKRAAPDVFYLPGGKREPGEDDLTCLWRELEEELGVAPVAPRPWREIIAPAALERRQHVRLKVYRARLDGPPRASAELASLRWWRQGDPARLAPAIEHHVVPGLLAAGLID